MPLIGVKCIFALVCYAARYTPAGDPLLPLRTLAAMTVDIKHEKATQFHADLMKIIERGEGKNKR